MNKQITQYLLGEKYGHSNIGQFNNIRYIIDMEQDDDGVWSKIKSTKQQITGTYFMNIETKEKIDLKKEINEGLYNKEIK